MVKPPHMTRHEAAREAWRLTQDEKQSSQEAANRISARGYPVSASTVQRMVRAERKTRQVPSSDDEVKAGRSPSVAEAVSRAQAAPDARKKKAKARKQSSKPPGFDERWVPWEELMHRVFGRDVVSCPACGSRIWLVARAVGQIVDPLSARLELALLGHPVQLVSFCPARGPPESLLP